MQLLQSNHRPRTFSTAPVKTAAPKSAILTVPDRERSMFCGLMSLWMTPSLMRTRHDTTRHDKTR